MQQSLEREITTVRTSVQTVEEERRSAQKKCHELELGMVLRRACCLPKCSAHVSWPTT